MRIALFLLLIAAPFGCASPVGASSLEGRRVSLPDAIQDMDGNRHAIGGTLDGGKAIAFVFWQTWCASCKSEVPSLSKAWKEHGTRMQFLGVVPGPDDKVDDAKVKATAREWGIPYPVIRDRDLRLTRALMVSGTPTIVIVGPGREIHFHGHHSPEDWSAVAGSCGKDGCKIPGAH